jgi:pyrimidodiazepine synthase
MLDFMIWPWCERSDMIRILVGDKYELDRSRFKHLLQWRDLMKNENAVKASFISAEDHAKFLKGRRVNNANYDMLV